MPRFSLPGPSQGIVLVDIVWTQSKCKKTTKPQPHAMKDKALLLPTVLGNPLSSCFIQQWQGHREVSAFNRTCVSNSPMCHFQHKHSLIWYRDYTIWHQSRGLDSTTLGVLTSSVCQQNKWQELSGFVRKIDIMRSISMDFAGKVFTPQQEALSLIDEFSRHQDNLILCCCLPEAGDSLKFPTAVSAAPLTSTGISSEHSWADNFVKKNIL